MESPCCNTPRTFMVRYNSWIRAGWFILVTFLGVSPLLAGEADIKIPALDNVHFGGLSGMTILYTGLFICLAGTAFGLVQYQQTKNLPVHPRMSEVSNIIWETCKTYLAQQGKFLIILWVLIACCMTYYFVGKKKKTIGELLLILTC